MSKVIKRIYLDYAATTPVDPAVFRAMKPYFTEKYGNAGSVHSFGQEAIAAIDSSRETIAKALGANFNEIIFTGSATEANNLVLQGVVMLQKQFQPEFRSGAKIPRIIISSIEHESVLATARALSNYGVDVVVLPVNNEGVINLEKLKKALTSETTLVSVMYANNEIGVIQPIKEISKIIAEFRKANTITDYTKGPFFHTDAVQAFQYFDVKVKELGVDFLTVSAHKIYGPKGIGALYARLPALRSYRLMPILHGGGQEYGLRSGTESVPSIVGFGKAIELAVKVREKEIKRVRTLRDFLWAELKKIYKDAELNGPALRSERLPNNLNVYLPREEAQYFLTKLDKLGIAASSGSACAARSLEPSYVIQALGYSDSRAKGSIRFSLGRGTTLSELKRALVLMQRAKK